MHSSWLPELRSGKRLFEEAGARIGLAVELRRISFLLTGSSRAQAQGRHGKSKKREGPGARPQRKRRASQNAEIRLKRRLRLRLPRWRTRIASGQELYRDARLARFRRSAPLRCSTRHPSPDRGGNERLRVEEWNEKGRKQRWRWNTRGSKTLERVCGRCGLPGFQRKNRQWRRLQA